MSTRPAITLIAAVSENGVIGRDGGLPWRLPADMKHFVEQTRGKPVVMGRKNYEDIGRPLPKRRNIVLSRRAGFEAPGCVVVHDPDAAVAAAGDAPEVMIIGGEEVYRDFLPRADRLQITLVHADIPGDTHFPEFDSAAWREVSREWRAADADNAHDMTFIEYRRRENAD